MLSLKNNNIESLLIFRKCCCGCVEPLIISNLVFSVFVVPFLHSRLPLETYCKPSTTVKGRKPRPAAATPSTRSRAPSGRVTRSSMKARRGVPDPEVGLFCIVIYGQRV